MTNWTDHVKLVAEKNKITYIQATKIASKTYKPKPQIKKDKAPNVKKDEKEKAVKKPKKTSVKKETHKMPDGSIMEGAVHPEPAKKKKQESSY